MRATVEIHETDAYAVHELKSSTGTIVCEYVSRSDGRVFGVTWQGPFIPDLKQLLGAYFQDYVQAAKLERESRLGRHSLNIQEPRLVFQAAGHQRAYYGRAYDPALLPAAVSADDIR